MFAREIAKSPEVRGLDARLHCKHLEKGSDEEIIITMQILGGNYPKSIYGMAHFESGLNFEKKEFEQGLVAILTNTRLMKWSKAIENITTEFSSSFYPKNIYGVPCFANLKFQTYLNLNSNSNGFKNRKEKQRKGKRKR